VKYLKYPTTKQLDDKSQKQVRYIISVLITVLILPSIYFAYLLIEEKSSNTKLISLQIINKGIAILYKTKFNQKPKQLELDFLQKI
jgi:hypothetical protein